jgi:hypothetical protein
MLPDRLGQRLDKPRIAAALDARLHPPAMTFPIFPPGKFQQQT